MARRPCVYLLASRKHGTLYLGVTSNIAERLETHRRGEGSKFAKKYHAKRLVYVEFHDTMPAAILREKQIKNWKRTWKVQLVETVNPEWDDLSRLHLS